MENQEIMQPWQIVSEIELVYRNTMHPSERPKIDSSQEAYQMLLGTWDQNKIEFVEQFKILLVSRANRALGVCEISTGGLFHVTVDARLIFGAALKGNACGIILAHNHPSGQLVASPQDLKLTTNMVEIGKLLEVPVVDHIIVTKEGYYSFADNGDL